MKKVSEAYVIVDTLGNDIIKDYISFDNGLLNLKCDELNEEFNDKILKNTKKLKLPFIYYDKFKVMRLNEAIDKIIDDIHYVYNYEG
jgi:hypothetical protein